MWQQAPSATTYKNIEDGIEDFAHIYCTWTTTQCEQRELVMRAVAIAGRLSLLDRVGAT